MAGAPTSCTPGFQTPAKVVKVRFAQVFSSTLRSKSRSRPSLDEQIDSVSRSNDGILRRLVGHHAAVASVDLQQDVADLEREDGHSSLLKKIHLEPRHLARRAVGDVDDGERFLDVNPTLRNMMAMKMRQRQRCR